ncbi:MAG: class I SAM-dependent RNA methyltransferase [Ancalomicrobiaceae bacterium]|nr:class I SAM-dependent RNA methyltransferase [Ancalomicrobiaceae bacterium]
MDDRREEIVTIAAIGHKGDGVAETGSGQLFVPLSLPGERLRVDRSGDRGRIVELIEPSPDRVSAPCPHFGTCGGCALQHMAEPAYLEMKRQAIVAAFADRGITVEVPLPVAVPPKSRRRAVIAVQRSGRSTVVGFRERLSHTVADAGQCLIVTETIRTALPSLARLAEVLSFDKKGAIFTVVDTETGLDVTATEGKLAESRRQEAIGLVLKLGFARFSVGDEIIVEARAPIVRFGKAAVTLPPGAFLQAVQPAEHAMVAEVLAATKGAKRVADLFAGCGTFALQLAETARVTAVENDKATLEALDRAARHTPGLKPVEAEARDLFRRPLMAKELSAFDAVVFDPPRDGAAAQAKEIAKSKLPVAIAVSCNPATLARDARYLLDGGYKLASVKAFDQFLWSHHVEVVARFER